MFSIPMRAGTVSNHTTGSVQNPHTSNTGGTHKMSVLFKNSNTIKGGYLGILENLVNLAAFAEVFGENPTILPLNPVILQDTMKKYRSLYYSDEKCKFDVSMHMCRRYYVGHNLVDISLSIQDMCCQISEVK